MSTASTVVRQLFDRASCTYTYIVMSMPSRSALLIDPVLPLVDRDLAVLKALDANLTKILNTHVHADHVTGSGALRSRLATPSSSSPRLVQTVISRASGAAADVRVQAGDRVEIGDGRFLEVRPTPGHTPGCIAFVTDDGKDVFTGDALLVGGCGRTDFQGELPSQISKHASFIHSHDYCSNTPRTSI